MLMTEEELAVEVAKVDGIEIDDMDFAEPGQDEVLEEFTTDSASAHQQDSRLEQEKRHSQRHDVVFRAK